MIESLLFIQIVRSKIRQKGELGFLASDSLPQRYENTALIFLCYFLSIKRKKVRMEKVALLSKQTHPCQSVEQKKERLFSALFLFTH